jgi:hypothetical protein
MPTYLSVLAGLSRSAGVRVLAVLAVLAERHGRILRTAHNHRPPLFRYSVPSLSSRRLLVLRRLGACFDTVALACATWRTPLRVAMSMPETVDTIGTPIAL